MQQHKCIPNNAGKREASHKRLINSVPFHFYKVRDNVKLNCLGKHTQVGKL